MKKISTILDLIDSGRIALPKFQRSYVWNGAQVRGFFHSLYRRHPVGSLLVWITDANTVEHRGNGSLAPGSVDMLLDGQQRITSLYGVVRGRPPKFFDGKKSSFTGLWFHLEEEIFQFYTARMKGDSLWIDVTKLMQEGMGAFRGQINSSDAPEERKDAYFDRLNRLFTITDIELHEEEITGKDKTLDVVVDIFTRVNSGGTKLSGGDLALAKVCTQWPGARDEMNDRLRDLRECGYDRFSLEWLLRSVNAVLTGEAMFEHLDGLNMQDFQDGLNRAVRHINGCLDMIGGRLGLDHGKILFGRQAIPVMAYYMDQKQGSIDEKERDKLLFWFAQAGMRGRYSGSAETKLAQDLATLRDSGRSLDVLLRSLQAWQVNFKVNPSHFEPWVRNSPFYSVLYMLTRIGGAQDWGNGLPLHDKHLGEMGRLEAHHIFPKAQLRKYKHDLKKINQLANLCFLKKGTNLKIGARLPEEYFAEIKQRYPGALASQWIPDDANLWKIENYIDFLEARRTLLATETNRQLEQLLHGDPQWL